jgi:hypothetical protein
VLELDEIHRHDGILFSKFRCQYALSVFLKPLFLSWLKNLSNQVVFCGFRAKIREFLDCLQSARRPSSNFSDALKTHIIAEKILARNLLG